MFLKKISLHPKLAAAIDFVFGVAFLLALTQVNSKKKLLAWIGGCFLVWAVLVFVTYYPAQIKKITHWLTLAWFAVGMVLWLIFIDWRVAWYVVGLVFVLLPAVSFWLIPTEHKVLTFVTKSYRRWRFLMSVAALSGIFSAVGASFTLQLFSPFPWWLSFVGALVAGGVAMWWWQEYDLGFSRRAWLTAGVLTLLFLELDLVVRLWPLGYFASGLLLAWCWYLLWLIFRFYLSPEGLIWRKQRPFLIFNGILLFVYLVFLVRWR